MAAGTFFLVAIAACNAEDKTAPADGAAPGAPPPQNVNGNVPDTTNSVNLNRTLPTDSSLLKKDSIRR